MDEEPRQGSRMETPLCDGLQDAYQQAEVLCPLSPEMKRELEKSDDPCALPAESWEGWDFMVKSLGVEGKDALKNTMRAIRVLAEATYAGLMGSPRGKRVDNISLEKTLELTLFGQIEELNSEEEADIEAVITDRKKTKRNKRTEYKFCVAVPQCADKSVQEWMTKQQLKKAYPEKYEKMLEQYTDIINKEEKKDLVEPEPEDEETVTADQTMSDVHALQNRVVAGVGDEMQHESGGKKDINPETAPRWEQNVEEYPQSSAVLGNTDVRIMQRGPLPTGSKMPARRNNGEVRPEDPHEFLNTPPVITPRDNVSGGQDGIGIPNSSCYKRDVFEIRDSSRSPHMPSPASLYGQIGDYRRDSRDRYQVAEMVPIPQEARLHSNNDMLGDFNAPKTHPLHGKRRLPPESHEPRTTGRRRPFDKYQSRSRLSMGPTPINQIIDYAGRSPGNTETVEKALDFMQTALGNEKRLLQEIEEVTKEREEWKLYAYELTNKIPGYSVDNLVHLQPDAEVEGIHRIDTANLRKIQELEQELCAVRKDLQKNEKMLYNYQHAEYNLGKYESRTSNLQIENEALKERLDNYQDYDSLKERLKEAESKISHLQVLPELKRQIEELREENGNLKKNLKESQDAADAIQSELNDMIASREKMGADLKASIENNEKLQSQLKKLEEENLKIDERNKQLINNVEEVQLKLKENENGIPPSAVSMMIEMGMRMQSLARESAEHANQEKSKLQEERKIVAELNRTVKKEPEIDSEEDSETESSSDSGNDRLTASGWRDSRISGAKHLGDGTVQLSVIFRDGYKALIDSEDLQRKPHCMKSLVQFYESRIVPRKHD
eukprot:jgi/Picsp_1/6054/NSC_03408-R1_---NA---